MAQPDPMHTAVHISFPVNTVPHQTIPCGPRRQQIGLVKPPAAYPPHKSRKNMAVRRSPNMSPHPGGPALMPESGGTLKAPDTPGKVPEQLQHFIEQ